MKKTLLFFFTLAILIWIASCSTATSNSEETTHVHNYGSWQITKEATCFENGKKIQSCNCGNTKSETIYATGHDWQDATCTAPRTCKNCGQTSGSTIAHNYVNSVCTSCFKSLAAPVSIECPENIKYIYTATNHIYSQGKLTNISYEFTEDRYDGLVLKITYDITKTYDEDGDFGDTPVHFQYVLYGNDGSIVASGREYSFDSMIVNQKKSGETFNIELDYIDTSYRLIFLDYSY